MTFDAERQPSHAAAPKYSSFTMVLPVYNEEARIARVVAYYRRFAPLLVVDNFSNDHTADIARRLGARVLQRRNAGTCQTPEWFRWIVTQFDTDHFVLLSCSEFIPEPLLQKFDEVARTRAADVVSSPRAIYTCGDRIPLWAELPVERFFDRRGLDYDAIVIHGTFAALDPGRMLRLPPEERYTIAHLRDTDAASLTQKHLAYAAIEARDRIRKGRPPTLRWLAAISVAEVVRFLRMSPSRWSFLALRESWSRLVMHSLVYWIAWEVRHGRGSEYARERSARLWHDLAEDRTRSTGAQSPTDGREAATRRAPPPG